MRCLWVAVLPLILAGCVTGPFARPPTAMLAKADRLAAAGEYGSAIVAYDAFLAQFADDAKACKGLLRCKIRLQDNDNVFAQNLSAAVGRIRDVDERHVLRSRRHLGELVQDGRLGDGTAVIVADDHDICSRWIFSGKQLHNASLQTVQIRDHRPNRAAQLIDLGARQFHGTDDTRCGAVAAWSGRAAHRGCSSCR